MVWIVAILVFLEELQDLGLAALQPLVFALNASFAIEVEEGIRHGLDGREGGYFGHGIWRCWTCYVCLARNDVQEVLEVVS
jgi:hypothetical protein